MSEAKFRPDSVYNYISEVASDIDSIDVISRDELENNKEIYPQNWVSMKHRYAFITSSEGCSKMNLNLLYNTLPNPLISILEFKPYITDSELLLIVTAQPYYVNESDASVSFDKSTPSINIKLNEYIDWYREDIKYISNTFETPISIKSPLSISSVSESRSWMQIHKDMIADIRIAALKRRWSITGSITDALAIKRVHTANRNSYFNVLLQARTPKKLYKSRKLFIYELTDLVTFDCPKCDTKESVHLSTHRETFYCSNCNYIPAQTLKKENLQTDSYIREYVRDIFNYTEEIDEINNISGPRTLSRYSLSELEVTDVNKSVYFGVGSDILTDKTNNLLYIPIHNSSLLIPYDIDEGNIFMNRTYDFQFGAIAPSCQFCRQRDNSRFYYNIEDVGFNTPNADKVSEFSCDGIILCDGCALNLKHHIECIISESEDIQSHIASNYI